jgi:hypothetical protein
MAIECPMEQVDLTFTLREDFRSLRHAPTRLLAG